MDEDDDCSKTMSAGAVAALPDDVLLEILSRVPAKSVHRFKCVSKAWHNLIAHPDNRKKLRQPMRGIFIMTPEMFWINRETGHYTFSLIDLTAGSSSVFPDVDDPGFSFLTKRPGMHNLVVMDSCNGLLLFGHHLGDHILPPDYVELGDIVCNPATKQWAVIPNCASPEDRYIHTFLAFDPAVSSHFHLVQFKTSDDNDMRFQAMHAYSSETGTWSDNQIDSREEQGLLAGWHRHVSITYGDPRRAFVDGLLYLVVLELDQYRILVVDVQGKARRMISVPGAVVWGHFSCYLEQSQGYLHCLTRELLYAPAEDNYKLSIWVLQDYDTQEWVLKTTVSSHDVFGGFFTVGCLADLKVVDIHQDRNVVFLFQYGTSKLVACDMDRKELSVIATFEEQKTPFAFARYVPCFSESPALTS